MFGLFFLLRKCAGRWWPLATTLAWVVALMGVSPVTFRVLPEIVKRESAASWGCARPVPSWHGLLGLCERGAGRQAAPLAAPRGLQRGGAD